MYSEGWPWEEVFPDFGGLSTNLYDTQIELGTACGKLFRCATMAILDAGKCYSTITVIYADPINMLEGDSDILSTGTA